MPFALSPAASEQGYRLEAHDTVASTNALALARAEAGDPGLLWIAALKQESGRGRRGRAWETPHGNLAATLLLEPVADLRLASTLGFVAGLALADALAETVPSGAIRLAADGASGEGARFELKWPNDVLAGGAKLAGILLESATTGGRHAIAIGIGVNVVAHPAGLPYPATSLRALGYRGGAEELFEALTAAWTRVHRLWDGGRGLAAIRRRWLAEAAGLGAEVAVKVYGAVRRGVFETIDEECRFVIRDSSGAAHAIAAGDVHFGAVASERILA